MADDIEPLGEAELVEGLEKKKLSGKKLVVIGGGVVGLLVVVFLVMSMLGGGDEAQPQKETEADKLDELAKDNTPEKPKEVKEEIKDIAFDLKKNPDDSGDITVPLNTGGAGDAFLSVTVSLVVDRQSYRDVIEREKAPIIIDDFITYLRELRLEDVEGSRGTERLREEMLSRINQSIAPIRVKNVLFTKFLVSSG